MSAAKRHGTIVSYDINYRPALWNASSHASDGMEVVKELAEHIDVLFGVQDVNDLSFLRSSVDSPMPSIVATTERTIESASVHNLAGHLWSEETGQISSDRYTGIDVFDRIGSGDAFASGIVNSLLDGLAVSEALEIGVAHALLAMTTPGDTSSADVDDIERIIKRLPPEISR
jgi:2-dehydro-3-deoxygluconokinase